MNATHSYTIIVIQMKINEQIPNLTLDIFQNEKFKSVNLDDFKGKWLVLLFYPADFSFVCPTELKEAADHYEEFKKMGAEVMSVSTDTKYVHKAWHDTSPFIGAIKYPMAADPNGAFCRIMETYIENEGMSLRGTFIVDPEGKLISSDIHSNDIGRSIGEIIRKLQAAIYVREHDGEVCPASWKPGKETLTKGIDLVGKI